MSSKTIWVRNVFQQFLDSAGFDFILLKNLSIINATDGKVNAEILVEPQHLNRLKILHGGMAATLVDIGGSLAIAAKGMNSTGLSTDINITYLDASRADDIIQMNSECVKFGRTLAFTVTELINKNNGKLIAHGRHTKFIAIAHKDPLNQFKFPEKKD